MPTYAYRCTVCGHELEVKQSFSDDSLTVCPDCGGDLRKLFNSVGVVFKGSGFYRTDSRSSSSTSSGASEGKTEKSSNSSGSSDSSSSNSGGEKKAASSSAPSKAASA